MSLVSSGDRVVRLLVIRHAESLANLQKKNILEGTAKEGVNFESYRFGDLNNMDPFLSPLGEEQCKLVKEKKFTSNHMNVKYVFVSPMRRTV